MAITSYGYDGSIGENIWARMAPRLALPYWVATQDDLAMKINTSQDRAIDIAPGDFGGVGVFDTSESTTTLTFDYVDVGWRYDLVVARRNWQGEGGKTTFEVIKGGKTLVLPPFNRSPGALDDQLLALVPLEAGRTRPDRIIDLRGFGTAGTILALDPLAMDGYSNWPGLQVQIGRETYTCQTDRSWVRTGLIYATTPGYRLRLVKTVNRKYGGGLQSVGGGWTRSGDNSMGLVVQSDGRLKVTKAGLYSFSTNVYNYDGKRKSEGTIRFRMAGLWVQPTFEIHRNAGTNGVEEALDWTGALNVGDVIDFQLAQYQTDKKNLNLTVEIQIEMVN